MFYSVIVAVLLTWLLQKKFNPEKSPYILFFIVLGITLGFRWLFSVDTIPLKIYKKLDEENSVQVVAEDF
jgi:hypothetical protein